MQFRLIFKNIVVKAILFWQTIPVEVDQKVRLIEGVNDVYVSVTWTPTWDKSMMSEAAQLELGMM